ncbi:MAG TPA: DNA replication and repair protein RecF [Thermoanaerobaculia bacterium]|nr:DNA replication and repair protein RecF [Thermoanaerobaculia bacterium]
MILDKLTTENFRNLAITDAEFHPRSNILVGRNGQGKTNLLEAIYFLATTKSFRTPRLASLFQFASRNIFVSGTLRRDGLTRTLSVGFESGETKRRALMINGEKVTLPVYLNAMHVFAYSASRLDVIRGTPEERRRFLDRGIASVSPAYLEQLTRYARVLRQRNALLAEIALRRQLLGSLDAWDNELMVAAAAVHRARAAYGEDLAAVFGEIVQRHGYHVANVEMAYRPSLTDDLAGRRKEELRARMSLAGPQRDAIEFLVDGRPAAEVLSGGEQKMIVLFLKFAKLELFRRRYEDAPLLLLDDIDAELDLEILQQLLNNLPVATQVFATSAKEAFLASLEAGPHRRLTFENGTVTGIRDFA